jgi:hypothetical protein
MLFSRISIQFRRMITERTFCPQQPDANSDWSPQTQIEGSREAERYSTYTIPA